MTSELTQAKSMYDNLQGDIQTYITEEYIKPQLTNDELINSFHTIIESEKCQQLDYTELIDPVTKIIGNKSALAQMCEKNTLGFKDVYHQHFVIKKNTFVRVHCPYTSMCMEFVMRKWH